MRHITKNVKNEPKTLKDYRSTPDANYAGFGDTGQQLKIALCQEQGYIYCYCMRQIDENTTSVEHYIPQSRHPDSPFSEAEHRKNQLKYSNLLASCNSKQRNCSKKRGNKPLTINPLELQIESLVTFSESRYIFENDTVRKDVEDTLHLLNDQNLEDGRDVVLDEIRASIAKWTKAEIIKQLSRWQHPNTKGKLRPFCQVAVAYLTKKLNQFK